MDIIIHPNSLVHAIVKLKNGLSEFIYHDTTMVVPIANAMFDGNFDIEDLYKQKNNSVENKLIFLKVDKKKFTIILIYPFVTKYTSSPIIINASNEILVDQFLKRKIPFLGIYKIIMSVLKDRNYKKNAIKSCKNINQIIKLDNWARKITFEKIKSIYA